MSNYRSWVKTFKAQFAPKVLDGSKTTTIRPFPKDGKCPRMRDIIDCRMWSAKPYGSTQVKLARFEIVSVFQVLIDDGDIYLIHGDLKKQVPEHVADGWAQQDGFKSYEEMYAWFEGNYKLPFKGIRIKWDFNLKR